MVVTLSVFCCVFGGVGDECLLLCFIGVGGGDECILCAPALVTRMMMPLFGCR